jgi:hypothetical protein
MRRVSLLVVAVMVTSFMAIAPAHADTRVCQVQHHWTFSNGLDTSSKSGTVTAAYQALCYRVGLAPLLYTGSGSFDYSGTCVLAILTSSSGVIGAIAGGAAGITVLAGSNTTLGAYALIPNLVCGAGTITDAYGEAVAVINF